MNNYIYFVPSDYPAFAKTCQKFLSGPEPGTVISPPKNGVVQRVEQLVQDYQDKFDRPLVQLDLSPSCEDLQGVMDLVSKKGYTLGKDKIHLLVTNATYALRSKNARIIDELIKIQYKTRMVHTVFFFEADITRPEYVSLFRQTHIFTQIYYYSQFDREDAERFIYYCCNEWHMKKPPVRIVKQIVNLCGGQIWLLRHAIREYRENPAIDFDRLIDLPSTRFRLEQIALSFSDEELRALTGQKDISDQTVQHLNRLNLLAKNRCTVPLLYEYLVTSRVKKTLELKDGSIVCDGVSLKYSFSRQETVLLRLFIQRKNKPVSRDEVADVLWKDEADEKYSAWAIEQLVKRLRIKLMGMGFPKSVIKTMRGVGYMYYSPS